MYLTEKPVNVTLIAQGERRRVDGYVTYMANGQEHRIAFEIDKPKLVEKGLSFHTHRRILRQLLRHGIEPTLIEIRCGNGFKSYSADFKENLNNLPTPDRKV